MTYQPPNQSNQLSRIIRLLVYVVIIGVMFYQYSQKASQKPLEKPVDDTPAISYVPAEQPPTEVKTEPEGNTNPPALEKKQEPQSEAPAESKPLGKSNPPAEKRTVENPPAESKPIQKAPAQPKIRTQIERQTIRDQDGEVIFTGTVDLAETIDRIRRGEELRQYRNDGIVFENRERRLPQHGPGYYREWVHPTPNERGPGPQRIVTGEKGEFYYTPNHYKSFIKLN
jgi:guanyl-specific ribonuclease Sa